MYKELQKLQKDLDGFIIAKEEARGVTHTPEDLLQHTLRALRNETAELENEMSTEFGMWKHWKVKPMDIEKAKEELIDCQHFLCSIFNQLGIEPVKPKTRKIKNIAQLFDRMNDSIAGLLKYAMTHTGEITLIRWCVDVYLYSLTQLADYLGMTEEDILKTYRHKWEINKKRQEEGY